jgi:AcrR family transcriptional regulator
MADRPRYHHGDLRNALLLAAVEILEGEGLDALTLRAVAARSGVSHAAPAHHFPTLKHLLTAIAIGAFQRFSAVQAEERARAADNPRAQLAAACDGYVRFARECPQQFRLMFSPSRLDWADVTFAGAGREAYRHLEEVCAPVAALRGDTSLEAQRALERMVWSSVHGYAHLLLAYQFGPPGTVDGLPPRPDIEDLLLPRAP